MNYKHYIRIDKQNRIIQAFSDAFRQPEDGDILIADTNERHFNLDLLRDDGFYRYEWNGKEIIERAGVTVDETIELAERKAQEELARSDAEIIRGIDDIINLLIEKKIINKSELPPDLQVKLEARDVLRTQ